MGKMTLTDAFRRYGAELANVQWAVSSVSRDNELVISLWSHYFGPNEGPPRTLRYTDRLSRWQGNRPGNNLLRSHLERAAVEQMSIRAVIARTPRTEVVDNGEDASNIPKTFIVRPDLIGSLSTFDGDQYIIDFVRRVR
jgi:hypothetical protein